MPTKRYFSCLLVTIFLFSNLLAACAGASPTPIEPVTGMPQGTAQRGWWNDSVFYQIFVRSFYDSDGDGIGDFNGITARLDYLNDGDPKTTTDLGVTGIWLMPIHPSPSYHGYDVLDYYAVNPQYGTMDDFKRFLEAAHQRGIRVVIDLVLNHTSVEHPWFIEARDNPDSPKREWYIFSETNPGYPGPWGQQVWHPSKSGYYYGIFWSGMPDLNFNNPEVTAEMLKVSRFWLQDVGVDGFRLDGARHLIEDGKTQENTEGTHTWWEGFRKEYKAINPQSFTVGEVWTTNYAVVEYVRGDEFDLAFNFDLASSVVKNVNGRSAKPIADGLRLSEKLLGGSNYATFLTNHDMNRVMNELGGSFEKARSAATILLTAPGVPFIYYGEEIGMSGKKPDELIRTPMQWSGEKNAGFTNGSPWESVNRDAKDIHVAAQEADPASLLNHYRALVHLRSQFASLRVGELFPVETGSDILLAFLRFYQNAAGEKEATLVLVNLGEKPLEKYQLDLKSGPLSGDYRAVVLLSAGDFGGAPALAGFTANAQGGFTDYVPSVSLPPDSSLVFQLLP